MVKVISYHITDMSYISHFTVNFLKVKINCILCRRWNPNNTAFKNGTINMEGHLDDFDLTVDNSLIACNQKDPRYMFVNFFHLILI